MEKGQIVELTIEDMSTEGQGIGRTDSGMVVFVQDALPGDTAEVELTKVKKNYAFGRIVEVLHESEYRRAERWCSYQDVCASSGHAETVRITYDADILSLRQILDRYFLIIDPVAYHRQGPDTGIQYRTGIYYCNPADLPEIEKRVAEEQEKYQQKLQVEVLPLENFYPAEEYHQKYLDKNPGGYCHIPERLLHYAQD